MKSSNVQIGLVVAIALAGCAQKPESIQASYVSPASYDAWTCKQLSPESHRVESALAVASKLQQEARTGDAVGIVLLGLPTASMTGQGVAPEVARLKGTKEAIHQSMAMKSC